ncbi:MAG: hypothetical protein ACOYK9_01205 [Chlamydiia bacterium]
MKITQYLTLAVLFFTSLSAESIDQITFGNVTYGKVTISEVNANGNVHLAGTKVSGSLNVNGNLKASDARLEKMTVNGEVLLENCTIKKMEVNGKMTLTKCSIEQKSQINGFVSATNCKFAGELVVASKKMVFDSCQIRSLSIPKESGSQIQVVELKGATRVAGSITFESGNGEVVLSSMSKVDGKVSGGKIRR